MGGTSGRTPTCGASPPGAGGPSGAPPRAGPGGGEHRRGSLSMSPSVDYIEKAYDDAKYGDFSKRPYLDCLLPSPLDPGMAPPGKPVTSIFVQYAPYTLRKGTWEERRGGGGGGGGRAPPGGAPPPPP